VKTINRKAFQERIIHRYLLEGFYLRSPKVLSLLPHNLRKMQINAVIPESSEIRTRPDMKLYFKNRSKPHSIEVKWSTDTNKNERQLKHLEKTNGSLFFLKGEPISNLENVNQQRLDSEDIQKWIRESSARLWLDTLSEYGEPESKKSWLLVMRGTYDYHWNKMKKVSPGKRSFWAFQNAKSTFDSIFKIGKGDNLYIMFALFGGTQQAVTKDIKKITYSKFHIEKFKIGEPHYFDESTKQGCIFEKSTNMSIDKRKYVHFISFESSDKGQEKNLNKQQTRKELSTIWDKICWSANHVGGIPVELNTSQANLLEKFF